MDKLKISRRQSLSSIAVFSSVSTSGCTLIGGGPDGTTTKVNRPEKIHLSSLYVSNSHSKSHTVDLKLRHDDETVVEETIQLEGASENRTESAEIERDWPDVAGVFVVRARVDDGEWRRQNLTRQNGAGTDCIRSMVKVMPDGTFGIWTSENCTE